MRCEVCPHLKEIQEALEPCHKCEAGKLHGQVSIDAAPTPWSVLSYGQITCHAPSECITDLEPDTEDKLRKALSIIFDLKPTELLLLQHTMHRRTASSLRFSLAKLRDALNKYDLSEESTNFRQLASTWKESIIEKFYPLKTFFDEVGEECKCKSGAEPID